MRRYIFIFLYRNRICTSISVCVVQNLPTDAKELVTLIADTDVLVAAETSQLAVVNFMRPWSAFVEVAGYMWTSQ